MKPIELLIQYVRSTCKEFNIVFFEETREFFGMSIGSVILAWHVTQYRAGTSECF